MTNVSKGYFPTLNETVSVKIHGVSNTNSSTMRNVTHVGVSEPSRYKIIETGPNAPAFFSKKDDTTIGKNVTESHVATNPVSYECAIIPKT